jgi:hypothetical protein
MKIPVDPEALTATWLPEALRQTGVIKNGSVISLDAKALGGDKGFTGRLVRLSLDYNMTEEGGPRSLVAKFSAANPGFREGAKAA